MNNPTSTLLLIPPSLSPVLGLVPILAELFKYFSYVVGGVVLSKT